MSSLAACLHLWPGNFSHILMTFSSLTYFGGRTNPFWKWIRWNYFYHHYPNNMPAILPKIVFSKDIWLLKKNRFENNVKALRKSYSLPCGSAEATVEKCRGDCGSNNYLFFVNARYFLLNFLSFFNCCVNYKQ